MHILVTNDDGVAAPGLAALASAMRDLGEVSVLAPARNWSSSGHGKTMHKPLRVWSAALQDGTPALATNGGPADSVALALLGLVEQPVDLVVCGINPRVNVSLDVTYSGTVTAAMEAAINRVPGIAVSVASDAPHGFGVPARAAVRVARRVSESGLPPLVLLNVNVPGLPEAEIKGARITRQGTRGYHDELIRRTDPEGAPYFWIGGDVPDEEFAPDTDVGAVAAGYVSITPLRLDLTAEDMLAPLRAWDL
jgi:5'-nucleotidase